MLDAIYVDPEIRPDPNHEAFASLPLDTSHRDFDSLFGIIHTRNVASGGANKKFNGFLSASFMKAEKGAMCSKPSESEVMVTIHGPEIKFSGGPFNFSARLDDNTFFNVSPPAKNVIRLATTDTPTGAPQILFFDHTDEVVYQSGNRASVVKKAKFNAPTDVIDLVFPREANRNQDSDGSFGQKSATEKAMQAWSAHVNFWLTKKPDEVPTVNLELAVAPAPVPTFDCLRRATVIRDATGYGLQIISRTGIKGSWIAKVTPGSAAARSEQLRVGDVIIELNGRCMLSASKEEIIAVLKQSSEADFVVAADADYDPEAEELARRYTMTPRTVQLQRLDGSFGFVIETNESGSGTHIATIKPGSAADRHGSIYVGDYILKVNGTTALYANREEVMAMIKATDGVLTLILTKSLSDEVRVFLFS